MKLLKQHGLFELFKRDKFPGGNEFTLNVFYIASMLSYLSTASVNCMDSAWHAQEGIYEDFYYNGL